MMEPESRHALHYFAFYIYVSSSLLCSLQAFSEVLFHPLAWDWLCFDVSRYPRPCWEQRHRGNGRRLREAATGTWSPKGSSPEPDGWQSRPREASVDHGSIPGGFLCCGQGTWTSKTRTGAELRLGCSGLQEKVRIKSGAFGGTGPS